MITCTGLDEFVNNRFEIDQLFNIENGQLAENGQIAETYRQQEDE